MVGGSNETSRRTIIPSSLAAANDDARQTTRIWRFSPNSHTEADTSACYKCLQNSDFGFVHLFLRSCRLNEPTSPDEQSGHPRRQSWLPWPGATRQPEN
jgi:hypothetical protein